MSKFMARYPTTNEEHGMEFAFTEIGSFDDFKFFTSTPGFEKNGGLAFRVAFGAATKCTNRKELCVYVGSMICAVSKDLKTSVLKALKGLGVEPRFVKLPYQAPQHNIIEAHVQGMDWRLILLNFANMCIFLFIKINTEEDFESFMSSCNVELRKRVGIEAEFQLSLIFDLSKADLIRTMLGASLTLRETLIKFIIYTMNQGRESIHSVCQFLFNILSWSGMDELILMNEILVIPQSSALGEHPKEAENLAEAIAAIHSHPYPQFFMHLASNEDLNKVDHSRFPTLIRIAEKKKLEIRL